MEAAYGIRAFPVLSLVMTLTATLVGACPVLAQTAPAAESAPPPGAAPVGVGVVAPQPSPTPPEFGHRVGVRVPPAHIGW